MKKLGFGMMRLPVRDETDRSTVDVEAVKQMVDLYMQRGFSYFDTAHRYNDEMSEPTIRKALVDRYPRESYVLADKITLNYIKHAKDQEPFLRMQLKTCGVDYFDNYLVHNMGSAWYPVAQRFGTFEFLKSMKDAGYIRHIGFSFHGTADVLETILQDHPEVEFVQLQINYLDWKDEGIQSEKCYKIARMHGKSIMVMEPIKGGTLINLPEEAGRLLDEADPEACFASWALRFAASLEGVSVVLSGMSTLGQVEENTSFMQEFSPLSNQESAILEKVAHSIRNKKEIGCTGCRYCTTECPKQIAIPEYFSLYNNMKRLKNTSYLANQTVYYANLSETHGKASQCIGCGLCEKNCPQNLRIRELLQRITITLEGAPAKQGR